MVDLEAFQIYWKALIVVGQIRLLSQALDW